MAEMNQELDSALENTSNPNGDETIEFFSIIGCSHYQRKCQISCPSCHDWFVCRLCHHDQILDHELDRFKVDLIKCSACYLEQEPSEHCSQCEIKFADNYCSICHLWTSDQIYHCNDCGICRKGPSDDFQHCNTCGTCMRIEHECQENILAGKCSICLENLFDSFKGVFVMACNHPIHQECFMSYLSSDYRCPICHKSAFDVSGYWKAIEESLSLEVLPSPYDRWRSEVFCLECQHQGIVPFHYQYHQCSSCKGFNTQKVRVIPFEVEVEASEDQSEESEEIN